MIFALALVAAIAPHTPPLAYEANSMRLEPNERRAVLDGAVRLSRGDLVVTGDHAVVIFAPEDKSPPSRRKRRATAGTGLVGHSLERFTVDGHVHVQRGTRTADAAHGELDESARTLVLTGTEDEDPVLRDGSERLVGSRILLQLDSEDAWVSRPRLVLRQSLPEIDAAGIATRVEADKLFLDKSERLAHFTDDVVVRRGDVTVRGPKMDAHYDASGQVTVLDLRGGVEMQQAERRAVAQNADYDARTRELILTGQPRLYEGDDVLVGERIAVALDSKQVRVDRARGRLRPDAHKTEPSAP
jgi:lipopolysaccharide export system protein LptA